MPRFKVVITDFDYGDNEIERAILEPVGAVVVALQAKSEDDLLPDMPDCDAVMNQYARVGRKAISAMRRCKVIARYGVGVDIVDVDAATENGILVTNVRDYCTEEVADHAIALWLALARSLWRYDRATHEGVWHWKSGQPVHRLRDQTMGIISFGKIGQAIAERARSFGVRIVAYDPYLPEAFFRARGVEPASKDELLSQSHAVMMQVPMTSETRHFLGVAEFARMRRGAIVVNTGRGPTIDNRALHEALASGHLAGAGLDDLEEEPAKRATWKPRGNPLFGLPNVIVTPHSAYYSEESIRIARETAAREVASVLIGETPKNAVNTIPAAAVF